jgi:Holliday junction resolvase RusA-like endonuclease
MRSVTFTIDGRPVPWKRQRTKGKQRFPAEGQKKAKLRVIEAFYEGAERYDLIRIDNALAVSMRVHAVFKLPQRIPKGDPRRMGSPHTFTPDADNLGKLVKDALNGIAYKDDSQVSDLRVTKQWSDHDRTTVTLEYIPVDRMGRAA